MKSQEVWDGQLIPRVFGLFTLMSIVCAIIIGTIFSDIAISLLVWLSVTLSVLFVSLIFGEIHLHKTFDKEGRCI